MVRCTPPVTSALKSTMIGMPTPTVSPGPGVMPLICSTRAAARVRKCVTAVVAAPAPFRATAVTVYAAPGRSPHRVDQLAPPGPNHPATADPPDATMTRLSVPPAAVTRTAASGATITAPSAGDTLTTAGGAGTPAGRRAARCPAAATGPAAATYQSTPASTKPPAPRPATACSAPRASPSTKDLRLSRNN